MNKFILFFFLYMKKYNFLPNLSLFLYILLIYLATNIFQTYQQYQMDELNIDKKIAKAVQLVSQSQVYQNKVFVFFCLIWTQVAFNSLINPMILTNPLLKCNNVPTSQGNYCIKKSLQNQSCHYENDFTGTYSADLYCQNRGIRMTLQSLFAFGSVTGALIVPIISDLKGKLITANFSILACVAGNLLVFFGIMFKFYFGIGLGMFISAFGSLALVTLSYSVNSDFFSDSKRQKAVIFYCACWGSTDMFILFVYYLMPYWWFYMIFLLLVPITCLYIYFKLFFLQSPHYLINAKSDYEGAKDIIYKLSSVNNAPTKDIKAALSIIAQIEFIKNQATQESPTSLPGSPNNQQLTFKEAMRLIVMTPKYLKAVMCLIFIKMAYYCFYYGVQGSLERTGFNFGISIFLLGFGQVTGYLTGSAFVPKYNRRFIIIVTNIFTAVVGLSYMTQTIQMSPFLGSIVLYLCFVSSSYNFSAISLVETQSFSSTIRSSAVGLQFGLSFMIRMILPFIIGFLNQRGISPIIAASFFIVLFGLYPAYILTQTFGYTNIQSPMQIKSTQLLELKLNNKQLDNF